MYIVLSFTKYFKLNGSFDVLAFSCVFLKYFSVCVCVSLCVCIDVCVCVSVTANNCGQRLRLRSFLSIDII